MSRVGRWRQSVGPNLKPDRYPYRGRAVVLGPIMAAIGLAALASGEVRLAQISLLSFSSALAGYWQPPQAPGDEARVWRIAALLLVLTPLLGLGSQWMSDGTFDTFAMVISVGAFIAVVVFKALPGFIRERREQA